jgi:hypothetical protein
VVCEAKRNWKRRTAVKRVIGPARRRVADGYGEGVVAVAVMGTDVSEWEEQRQRWHHGG